jgi:hypothetical protein
MNTEWAVFSDSFQTASHVLRNRKRSDQRLFLLLFMSTLCLVPLLVIGGLKFGTSMMLAVLGVVIILALVVRWPVFGFFLVLVCTLVIDQSPLPVLGNKPLIYVFYWPAFVQGLPDRPIGFLMLLIVLVLVVSGLLQRQRLLQGGGLLLPYLGLLACVVWGVVHGLSSGGSLQITVDEVRSFWYLFLGYLLAFNLISSKKHLRSFFWCVILCAGIKALEGCYIYFFVIHGDLAHNHEIMSHEESYFWISIVLLVMLFGLHHKYRPQFYTSLFLMPFLLLSLVANNRRADFVALVVGLAVAWLLIFLVRPEARKLLLTIFFVTLLLGGAYVAAFYKGSGGFSTPARSIVSVFYPDAAEAASNAYRTIENYDLQYTIKLNPMGLGFGKPFLQPVLLPNLLSIDPVYLYIPHNTIYWVWMRLGPIGYLALWYLFGSMISRGCIYVRKLQDKYLQLAAIYIVAMVVMEIMVAYADYQLSFYRNVIYVGMLVGVLMKLPALDTQKGTLPDPETKKDTALYETTRAHSELSRSLVGGRYA